MRSFRSKKVFRLPEEELPRLEIEAEPAKQIHGMKIADTGHFLCEIQKRTW